MGSAPLASRARGGVARSGEYVEIAARGTSPIRRCARRGWPRHEADASEGDPESASLRRRASGRRRRLASEQTEQREHVSSPPRPARIAAQ